MRFQLDPWNGPRCSVKYSVCGASLPSLSLPLLPPVGPWSVGPRRAPLLSRSRSKELTPIGNAVLELVWVEPPAREQRKNEDH